MRKKIGRNEPCWCGSSLKYKRCHLDRDKMEPLKPWEADKEFRRAFSAEECLAPEPMKSGCSNVIVKAHTVPRSGSLQQIARKGHVYSYIPTPSLLNLTKYGGKLQPRLVGINLASTFNGFCSIHDNRIFSKIENQAFVSSQEQCFLLAYRALTRELYAKKSAASLSNVRHQLDRGKSLEQQTVIQTLNHGVDIGTSAGLGDSEYHKEIHDKVLLSGDFGTVHAYVIELESPPPIMCSGGMFPEYDFQGNQLQDLLDLKIKPHLITFTSFYGGNCGIIVFSWLSSSHPTCERFINSLRELPPNRVTDALIRFFFEFCENLHIAPLWWESFEARKRDTLERRFATAVSLFSPRNPACIAEDGVEFDDWPFIVSKKIGF